MTLNIPETNKQRIVIVGAGFGGMTLAQKLAKHKDKQIVLLDKFNYHQFQPLFYQVAMAGLEPSSISFPLRKAFQKKENVIIRICELEQIDAEQKEIQTSLGPLKYDQLVLAMGAKTNFFGNEKIEKHSLTLKSTEDALKLRNSIFLDYENALLTDDFEDRQGFIDIVIVGGGPTGVELAGALAEMRNYILPKDYVELNNEEVDIYLFQGGDQLLQGMSKKSADAAEKFLTKMGVDVELNTRVTDIDENFVYTNDGRQIRARKVIWAAGVTCDKITGIASDCYCRGNRLAVDQQLKLKGSEDIFVLGDLAYMEEENFPNGHPQVASVAIQQGQFLYKHLTKGRKRSFSYKDKGSMATIGRNKAVVDLPKFHLNGFIAWVLWLVVHLFALIGVKNKVFVFFNWLWNYLTYDQSLRLIIRPKAEKNAD